MAEETHGAHTEVPSAGHKAPFPPFMKETFPSQLIWLAITFVALYVVMARVALPRIGAILAARQGRIADDMGEAQRLKTEADTTLAAYEQSLADARSRAQTIAAETRSRLNHEAEAQRHALEADLNAKLAEAEKTIAVARTAAMGNVRGIAIEAAAAIVERLIGTTPAAPSVEAAVEAALKQ
jgi:F-type H+-transporting ATPase subunit b